MVINLNQKLVPKKAHIWDKTTDIQSVQKSCCILKYQNWGQNHVSKVDWNNNFVTIRILTSMPTGGNSDHKRILRPSWQGSPKQLSRPGGQFQSWRWGKKGKSYMTTYGKTSIRRDGIDWTTKVKKSMRIAANAGSKTSMDRSLTRKGSAIEAENEIPRAWRMPQVAWGWEKINHTRETNRRSKQGEATRLWWRLGTLKTSDRIIEGRTRWPTCQRRWERGIIKRDTRMIWSH